MPLYWLCLPDWDSIAPRPRPSRRTDHEKAQHRWNSRWSRVLDGGALLASMVAKSCDASPCWCPSRPTANCDERCGCQPKSAPTGISPGILLLTASWGWRSPTWEPRPNRRRAGSRDPLRPGALRLLIWTHWLTGTWQHGATHLGGQRGRDHEDCGDSTNDRKLAEHKIATCPAPFQQPPRLALWNSFQRSNNLSAYSHCPRSSLDQ